MTEHTPDLLPCPFCGGDAEIDTNQSFCAFPSGKLETAISVYCLECTAAVTVCKSDVPGIWPEEVVEMWNRRAPDLLAENTRLREINAGLVEALTEAESVFALVEQPRGKDRDHGPEVEALGLRIGFGALMSSAQASWREYATERGHAGSEFVAGPCYSTILSAVNMIRAALRAAEEGV